jgi:hypothetical protein
MFHTKLPRVVTGLLLAGLLVTGCAEPDTDDSGAGQGATTVPTTLPDNPPTTEPTEPSGEVTVTGTVIEGVEPNCLLLDADGRQYLLVGGDRSVLQAGVRVAVTGRVDRGLLSTCQQGEPLVVSAFERAP